MIARLEDLLGRRDIMQASIGSPWLAGCVHALYAMDARGEAPTGATVRAFARRALDAARRREQARYALASQATGHGACLVRG
jgi:hypothetical protein